nr:hypothetical protein QOL21_02385 [Acholeplasma laidlawii]
MIANDADIEFMGLDSDVGMRIYEATLRYVFTKALYEIDASLIPSNSILLEFIGGSPFHD